MKNLINSVILFAIINCAQLIKTDDELFELNCDDESQCKIFQHSGIKSSCLEEQCRCSTSSGENVKCQPLNSRMSNFVGGSCPCMIPNADCDIKQDICYCVVDFQRSRDKRRCIQKTVALDGQCEEDSQCQNSDFNAICHVSKSCKCMDQFVNDKGKCVSILGNKAFAKNNAQCYEEYGANTRYHNESQQCICKPGYFASIDNSRCLKISKYLERCIENLQCIGTMGLGGHCAENVCQCAEKYYVEENKTNEGAIETVCTAVAQRGHYCRYDEECYQRQLNQSGQTMHCVYGECNCKMGYSSYNDSECVKGNGADMKPSLGLWYITALVIIVFKIKFFINSVTM